MKPDTKAIRARAGQGMHYGATAAQTIALCDRVEALEAALRSTAQRHHLSKHDFKTDFDTCGEDVCHRANAALEGK